MKFLYNLLFPIVFLLLLPGYLRRMVRRGNYRRHFGQRLGFYSREVRIRLADGPPKIWLQAVSVGEMLTALKLVAALRGRQPGLQLVLSTTTTTGYQLARERVGAGIEVVYTPVDLAGAVRRAFDVLRPERVVIVDGGLWPNLLWEARRRGIPTALVNARLSPRSERRYQRWRFLAVSMFRLLDLVCVSEGADMLRWEQLGVPAAHLRHTGSIKFDDAISARSEPLDTTEEPQAFLNNLGVLPETPLLLAGSTHPGEERLLALVFQNLRLRFPDLKFMVAPRHVERAREVRHELETLGLKVVSRSEPPAGQIPFDTLLLDTTGELRDWYATATLVFIGKSLLSVGGQNPAEAIAAGRAVVFGPHMENFRDLVARLLETDGAVQVNDAAELEVVCKRLLAYPAERTRLAVNGLRQLAAHRGAAARTAELLLVRQGKLSTCQDG